MFASDIAFLAASIPTLAKKDNFDSSSLSVIGFIMLGLSEFFLSIILLVFIPDALRINSSDECDLALIFPLSIKDAFSILKLST